MSQKRMTCVVILIASFLGGLLFHLVSALIHFYYLWGFTRAFLEHVFFQDRIFDLLAASLTLPTQFLVLGLLLSHFVPRKLPRWAIFLTIPFLFPYVCEILILFKMESYFFRSYIEQRYYLLLWIRLISPVIGYFISLLIVYKVRGPRRQLSNTHSVGG